MTFRLVMLFMVLVFARPQEWLFPWIFGIPVLDAVFLLSLAGLLFESNERTIEFPPKCPQTWLLLGVVLGSMMSHISHTYLHALIITTPLVLKTVLYSILLITVLNRVDRLRAMGRLLVGVTCLMALHVILQDTRGYGLGGDQPDYVFTVSKGWYARCMFYGIFADPNDTAQMLVAAVPFAFGVTRRKTVSGRLLGVGIACFLIRGMMTTHSRGGLVGLLVTLCVMVILLLPAKWTPTLLILMAAGALIVAPVVAVGRMDESAHQRFIFWGHANYAFKRNMLFGVGTNRVSDFIEGARSVHSTYVLCYTEMGVFGYWFWYGLIHTGFIGTWRVRKAFKWAVSVDAIWLKGFSGQAIASMCGYCASSYFLGRAFVYPIFFMFALMAAIPIVGRKMLPDDHPPLLNVRKDLYFTSTIGALGSIMYIYISIVLLNHIAYPE